MSRFLRILNTIVFGGLLVVIALAVFPYGTVDAWWESIFECSVFALTALWIVSAVLGRDFQLRRASMTLPLVAITLYAFVQAMAWPPRWFNSAVAQHMLSIDHYQTYITARKSLALTLFFGLMLIHTSTTKRLRLLVLTVIVIGITSGVFGILRQFLQTPESDGVFIFPFLFYGVGYGQFISANPFAYLMEMVLALLAGLVLGGGVARSRVLVYVALMFIVWTALVLSNSRGGLVALACESVFVLFFALNWYSSRLLARGGQPSNLLVFVTQSLLVRVGVVVLFLACVAGGVLWIGGDSLASKLNGKPVSVSASPDEITRREIWRASWKLFRNSPWTGTGLGAYYLGIPQFELNSGALKLEQAHNDYLDLAASGGLISLALGIWFISLLIVRAKNNFKSRGAYRRAAALGAAAGILGVALHSFVDFGLQLTGIAVVFAALAVILTADVPDTDDRLSAHRARRRRPRLRSVESAGPLAE